jgi:hypothetical protein
MNSFYVCSLHTIFIGLAKLLNLQNMQVAISINVLIANELMAKEVCQ